MKRCKKQWFHKEIAQFVLLKCLFLYKINTMEQAIIVIWGFMGPLILGCIIGIIYVFYDNKRQEKEQPPISG